MRSLELLAILWVPGRIGPAVEPAVVAPQTEVAPTVIGTVKDSLGRPLAGATVTLGPPDAEAGGRVTTDSLGEFRIEAPGPSLLTVRAPGKATHRQNVRPGARVNLTLRDGVAIEGVVRDVGGHGISGARIQAFRDPDILPIAESMSGSQGAFRLEGLEPGSYAVAASAQVLGSTSGVSEAPGHLDLTLRSGALLRGDVRCLDGSPVFQAHVVVEGIARGRSPSRAVTDVLGRFEVTGLDPGSYSVAALRDGYAPAWSPRVDVSREGDAHVTLRFSPGISLVGRLVADPRRPLEGWVKVVEIEGRPVPPSLASRWSVDSGKDGVFTLAGVAAASSYRLRAGANDYLTRGVPARRTTKQSRLEVGDVQLDRGPELFGRVYDRRTGKGLSGATVEIATEFGVPAAKKQTSPDGSFAATGLPTGKLWVTARAPGYVEKIAPASTGSRADFGLTSGAAVTGVVFGQDGHPVTAYSVVAAPAAVGDPKGAERPTGTQETQDPSGRFTLEGLGQGLYRILINGHEKGTAEVPSVQLAAGERAELGSVTLSPGVALRGTVSDASGGPVGGATITLSRPLYRLDSVNLPVSLSVSSDASGRFEFPGVPAGTLDVAAVHPDYSPSPEQAVVVKPGEEPPPVVFSLNAGGRIEGSLRNRDGVGLPGVPITIWISGPGARTSRDVSTIADGSFRAEHVTPGPVSVNVMGPSLGGVSSPLAHQEISVREGETTTVDLRESPVLVTGRVTKSGLGLPGVTVNLSGNTSHYSSQGSDSEAGSGDAQPFVGTTDATGSYRLLVGNPGVYFARVGSVSGPLLLQRVEVPDADAFTLDLTLEGSRLSGIVVARGSGKAIPGSRVAARVKVGDGWTQVATESGADGRFSLEGLVLPATIQTNAEGYVASDLPVGDPLPSEFRIELTPAGTVHGRVVDAQGSGVGAVLVTSRSSVGPRSSEYTITAADGSFDVTGAGGDPCNLLAIGPGNTFALASGVAPGQDALLTLAPGGWIRVQGTDAAGAPAVGVSVNVEAVQGSPVLLVLGNGQWISFGSKTDADGTVQIAAPTGEVSLSLSSMNLRGTTTVEVLPGVVTAIVVPLQPRRAAR